MLLDCLPHKIYLIILFSFKALGDWTYVTKAKKQHIGKYYLCFGRLWVLDDRADMTKFTNIIKRVNPVKLLDIFRPQTQDSRLEDMYIMITNKICGVLYFYTF